MRNLPAHAISHGTAQLRMPQHVSASSNKNAGDETGPSGESTLRQTSVGKDADPLRPVEQTPDRGRFSSQTAPSSRQRGPSPRQGGDFSARNAKNATHRSSPQRERFEASSAQASGRVRGGEEHFHGGSPARESVTVPRQWETPQSRTSLNLIGDDDNFDNSRDDSKSKTGIKEHQTKNSNLPSETTKEHL